jgi:hypothetical protein
VLPGDLSDESDLDAGLGGGAAVAVEHVDLVSLVVVIGDDAVELIEDVRGDGHVDLAPADL